MRRLPSPRAPGRSTRRCHRHLRAYHTLTHKPLQLRGPSYDLVHHVAAREAALVGRCATKTSAAALPVVLLSLTICNNPWYWRCRPSLTPHAQITKLGLSKWSADGKWVCLKPLSGPCRTPQQICDFGGFFGERPPAHGCEVAFFNSDLSCWCVPSARWTPARLPCSFLIQRPSIPALHLFISSMSLGVALHACSCAHCMTTYTGSLRA